MNELLLKARARLRDTQGFMLAEQLFTVLILGFLCLAVASGLGVCLKIQHDISTESAAQNLLARAIMVVDDQLEFSLDPQDGQAEFISATTHQKVMLSSEADTGIVLVQSDDADAQTVLVAQNSGLYPVFASDASPRYDASLNAWTYTLNVVTSSGTVVKSQQVGVKRISSAPAA